MSKRKPTIGNSIHDLKAYIENVPPISNSKKLSIYLSAADKLLSAGKSCHIKKDYENEYIYKMRYVVFIMKLMKEHKEFTDETMKNELRLKCKSIIEELEDLKVVLKQIYDQNRNEIDEEEEMEDVDLHNEEENTLESNNEIDKEEVKEENKELLIKEENGKEMAHENIPSESDNTPNESDNIESISDFSFKNEIQKYFIDERREIYDRMVYESNSFKEKQNKVFHDDHVMKLSTPQLETTNIIKESNNIESFSKQTLNDNNQNVDIFPSFTQTIRGGQFNPDYIRPENLMTYGPTCTHKPSKSISNLSSSSLQPHIELPIQMNKKHPHEINNKPIPPMINIKPTSFPILTNQKPTISSNETVAKLTRIEIDGEILDSFMKCAFENSKKNIETCGNLAGKLDKERNVFTLTHVLIPKQKGTPDTCITSNEEDIVEYQIKNDLITLGWIHTHPSQACFLSSVDLHTHYSYQKLFNEAIAIVIAPRDNPNFSIFRLSDYGVDIIGKCTYNGFHYHEERGLYETCRHVFLRWNVKKFKMVDFR